MTSINELFDFELRNEYQKDNFEDFLKSVSFDFDLPGVHVAGTNGKGSTCRYIASILKESGLKVGLFQSPHFYEINELISINDVLISDEEIKNACNEFYKKIKKFDLSPFEIETFVAFTYFKKMCCDVVVIECGMGGEFDATNIFAPDVSVITSISLEHTDYLGRSLSEIAETKGGIIKEYKPVVISELVSEAEETIVSIAKQKKSKIYKIAKLAATSLENNGIKFNYLTFKDLKIKSLAQYSLTDACLAIETIKLLRERFTITDENIYNGLWNVSFTCRMEKISDKPLVIIDGGHNPEAIDSLISSIRYRYSHYRVHIVFASFRDKNIVSMLPALSVLSNDITLTTFNHVRARTKEEYFLYLDEFPFIDDYMGAVKKKMDEFPDDLILVTGSLAFVSIFRKEFFGE